MIRSRSIPEWKIWASLHVFVGIGVPVAVADPDQVQDVLNKVPILEAQLRTTSLDIPQDRDDSPLKKVSNV